MTCRQERLGCTSISCERMVSLVHLHGSKAVSLYVTWPTPQKNAHRIEFCMRLLESAQETTGMKSFQLAHFSKPCFGIIASLCLVDWPRICSKSSVQNVAFDTLVKQCIYASQRAILASLSHGCRAVAKRYKCPLL